MDESLQNFPKITTEEALKRAVDANHALSRRIGVLESNYEPWRHCRPHDFQTFPTLSGPDHGCQCTKCGIHKDAWERLSAGEKPWWYKQ